LQLQSDEKYSPVQPMAGTLEKPEPKVISA